MNAVKNSARLLALAVPFVLYAAWQVHSATRLDAGTRALPADTGPTQEQLAASSAKTAAAVTETRKAIEVTWQYRPAAPVDKSADPNVDATVKAAAARSADLADLDKFLSGAEKPAFTGGLKDKYTGWAGDQIAVRQAEDAVKQWFRNPLSIASVADADKAVAEVTKLVGDYAGRSRFASKGRAAEWRLQARLKVVEPLAAVAAREYTTAAQAKLPLDSGADASKTALATLRGLKKHVDELKTELRQADTDKVALPPDIRKGAEDRSATAADYAAREELFALFAQKDLFDNPAGAEPWLKKVREQYAKTTDRAVQKLIRDKVQEFADAFVPPAALLDGKVLVQGAEVPREKVSIKYDAGQGEFKRAPLSANADGLNEFNFVKRHPGDDTVVLVDGSEEDGLKPTDASKAAVAFNDARKKVSDRAPSRWTAESVAALKKACEPQRELVDQLRTPGQKDADRAPKIATRVLGLSAGVTACKELFEPVQ